MQEIVKSAAIYNPKNIFEINSILLKNSSVLLFAGGTEIMSEKDFFPQEKPKDIINLSSIVELTHIQHSDKYFDAFSMATLNQIISKGKLVLPSQVIAAISSIGTSIVRNQITIGGAICTKKTRNFISNILATLNAQVEFRPVKKHSSTKWIPITSFYKPDGTLFFTKPIVVTRIRIPAQATNSEFVFKTIGIPNKDIDSCVMFGLEYTIVTGGLSRCYSCISFPEAGFCCNSEINSIFDSISLPCTPSEINDVASKIAAIIKQECPLATPLQIERVKRIVQNSIFNISNAYISPN